jgi:signal transduction histidine kinase
MQKGFLHNSRPEILSFINKVIDETPELQQLVVSLDKGEVLFKEGETLSYLYLLLDGSVILTHEQTDDFAFDVLNLEPGHFVGLVAFNTGNDSLTTATASAKTKALRFGQDNFERYVNEHPALRSPLQQLMMSNMTDRFMINLKLESKMHVLNQKLEEEGEQLKEAYQKLEESQQKMVHQEKMATLGELVAGFAHEVNNPASALLRSSENLMKIFKELPGDDPRARMFEIGLNSEPLSSNEVRDRMLIAQKKFPWVKERPMIRKLAQMPDEGYEIIHSSKKKIPVPTLVQQFEAGKFIHNIQVASERIANLVKSLKSYSRQDNNQDEMIDIREGIKDTILILSNRLKYLNVDLQLNEIPKTCARLGELNQVWTNIIVNACDVLEDGEDLAIRAYTEGDYKIIVEISDNGPGIPEDQIDRIFEPNFTTKNQGAEFGLGLGLAISNEIIRQHGGFIRVSNKKEGGAKFQIILPVRDC